MSLAFQQAVDALFEQQYTLQFYEWLNTFEQYIVCKCEAHDMLPADKDIITLSKDVLVRYMKKKGVVTLNAFARYAMVSYMMCFKYHVDTLCDPADAHFAVKSFAKTSTAFTLEMYKATEWDMYETLDYRIDESIAAINISPREEESKVAERAEPLQLHVVSSSLDALQLE